MALFSLFLYLFFIFLEGGGGGTVFAKSIPILLFYSLKQMSKKIVIFVLKVISVSFLVEGIEPSPQMMIY